MHTVSSDHTECLQDISREMLKKEQDRRFDVVFFGRKTVPTSDSRFKRQAPPPWEMFMGARLPVKQHILPKTCACSRSQPISCNCWLLSLSYRWYFLHVVNVSSASDQCCLTKSLADGVLENMLHRPKWPCQERACGNLCGSSCGPSCGWRGRRGGEGRRGTRRGRRGGRGAFSACQLLQNKGLRLIFWMGQSDDPLTQRTNTE